MAKARAKRIIADSIHHVSSPKTPKVSVCCYDEVIEEEQDIVINTLNGLLGS